MANEIQMRVRFEDVKLSLIDLNEGQIPGLNRNPREWTYNDVTRLKKSIEKTPELLKARGIIVYPYDFRYIAIGGNMRLTALRDMGAESAPCVILPEDISVDELAAIAIKDNGDFGRWDKEKLKKDWADCPLAEWGIDVFEYEDADVQQEKPKDSIDDGKSEYKITLSATEFDYVNCALREVCPGDSSKAFLTVMGYYGE